LEDIADKRDLDVTKADFARREDWANVLTKLQLKPETAMTDTRQQGPEIHHGASREELRKSEREKWATLIVNRHRIVISIFLKTSIVSRLSSYVFRSLKKVNLQKIETASKYYDDEYQTITSITVQAFRDHELSKWYCAFSSR
jgi:hypothetical protein